VFPDIRSIENGFRPIRVRRDCGCFPAFTGSTVRYNPPVNRIRLLSEQVANQIAAGMGLGTLKKGVSFIIL